MKAKRIASHLAKIIEEEYQLREGLVLKLLASVVSAQEENIERMEGELDKHREGCIPKEDYDNLYDEFKELESKLDLTKSELDSLQEAYDRVINVVENWIGKSK